jgi:outer membrane protein, multidrug efflux system
VQFREGVATQVDTGLQAIEIRRLEADRSRVVEARYVTMNALAILVGTEPSLFTLGPATLKQLRQPAFQIDQPGMVLARRPDVQAAEARIIAANGEIARARAAFLPGIRLSASAFTDVASLRNFPSLTLSSGLDLVTPIFNRRRLKGELLTASGEQQEVVANYRRVILVALGEVSDALTALDQSQQREQLLTKTIQAARRTAQLARRQYVEGAADLQTIFDAQRGLTEVEEAYVLALQQRLEASISLYRAIGGAPADIDPKLRYALE